MKLIEGDMMAIANIRQAYFDALDGIQKGESGGEGIKFSPKEGYTSDGKPIYSSNFPEGSTRSQRQARILQLIQEVWSKKPITLEIIRNGKQETIVAQFDPFYYPDPRSGIFSDATKLAYGNRKGTMSDQKVTEKLDDDFPEIISNSRYVKSKTETGKENPAHRGVSVWHYFANEIVFQNEQGLYADYNVNVDVKENDDGDFVYSFAAENKRLGTENRTEPWQRSEDFTCFG